MTMRFLLPPPDFFTRGLERFEMPEPEDIELRFDTRASKSHRRRTEEQKQKQAEQKREQRKLRKSYEVDV